MRTKQHNERRKHEEDYLDYRIVEKLGGPPDEETVKRNKSWSIGPLYCFLGEEKAAA